MRGSAVQLAARPPWRRSPPAASARWSPCSGRRPRRGRPEAGRASPRDHRVHRVVVGQPQRPVAVQRADRGGTAASAWRATRCRSRGRRGGRCRTSDDSSSQPRATSARTPAERGRAFMSPASTIGAPRANRSSRKPARSSWCWLSPWSAWTFATTNSRPAAAVAKPHELRDPRLAAQPCALVQRARRADTSSSSGAVEQRVGLSLDLGAHEVGQRVANGGTDRQRQRDVHERDMRPVGTARASRPCRCARGAAARPTPAPPGAGSGRAGPRSSPRPSRAAACGGRARGRRRRRHVHAVGDVPGAEVERDRGSATVGDPR